MPGSFAPSSVHQILRERTRDLHADLDGRVQLTRPGAGRAQYARHVMAMYGWLQPLEHLFQHLHWPADLEPAQRWHKVAWLQQDIDTARGEGFITAAPDVCAQAGPARMGAARYGWAYVVEGSMLGGQVLLKRLSDQLKPWPMRYLQGYGPAAGLRWRSFLAAMERDVRSEADIDAAAAGAVEAFTSIGVWLRARGAA